MDTSQIVDLLSGVGIGAVLSAVLLFINNSKKNKLDFITKERSEWRSEIKSIIVDLLTKSDQNTAIARLETQLNPYGRSISEEYSKYEFYMNDGHIWKLVNDFGYSNENVKILTEYLELLLKYDWERSKREVNFSYTGVLYKVFNIAITIGLLFLFFTMKRTWFTSTVISVFGFVIPFLVIILPLSLFVPKILDLLKKTKLEKRKKESILYFILLLVPYLFFVCYLIYVGDEIFSKDILFLNRRIVIVFTVIYLIWLYNFLLGNNRNSFEELEIRYIKKIKNVKENTHV